MTLGKPTLAGLALALHPRIAQARNWACFVQLPNAAKRVTLPNGELQNRAHSSTASASVAIRATQ